MALITWNESLSVNIAEIDRQHKKLIGMVNDLNDAMKVGKGKEVLGEIVRGLVSYTVTHFRAEENYFDRYGYPETDAHKKEHAAFIEKVTDFKDKFESKNLFLTIEVMNFLSDWLKNHIMGTDKKYSRFFNEKGVK
jgi:hemerythrin